MTEWIARGGDFLDQVKVRIKRGSLPGLYRKVFDSDAGRTVLADLHQKAGLMHESLNLPSELLHETAGAQAMVLHIDKMLRLTPPTLQQIADMEVLDD